jgi:hypothetical protein
MRFTEMLDGHDILGPEPAIARPGGTGEQLKAVLLWQQHAPIERPTLTQGILDLDGLHSDLVYPYTYYREEESSKNRET